MNKQQFREAHRLTLLGLVVEGVATLKPSDEARLRLLRSLPSTVDQLLDKMFDSAHSMDDSLFPSRNGKEVGNG